MSKNILYTSNIFSLSFDQYEGQAELCMQMNVPIVNTKDLPQTFVFLQTVFPSVLKTHCFNEQNLPFSEEVKRTEIGHLFEHIVLDALCIAKVNAGVKKAIHRGITSWNWEQDKTGTFHITIDSNSEDEIVLKNAVVKAIALIEELFTQTNKQSEDRLSVYHYPLV